MRMNGKTALCAAMVTVLAFGCLGAEEEVHRKGRFQLTFTESDPRGGVEIMEKKRHLISESDKRPEYDLSTITYEVLVPESYDPETFVPLLVWISPTDSGNPPKELVGALERRGILFIGANGSGNEKGVYLRFRAAIDAVYNMRRRYTIDEKKIIVAGLSGGGRCASMLTVVYPDIFTFGGLFCAGCNFYDDVIDAQRRKYVGYWQKKDTKLLGLAKQHYLAFLTGTKDFNRDDTRRVLGGFRKAGFRHHFYYENPQMDHRMSDPEDIEKAFAFFDEGLYPEAFAAYRAAEQAFKNRQFALAAQKAAVAKEHFAAAGTLWEKLTEQAGAETEKLLATPNLRPALLRPRLQAVIQKYGPAAETAKTKLQELTAPPAP
ncbi:MAG: hypothetical protein J6334_12555 [Kiritimatiellae bacterium]|nr:hypothetical protein [Kiritimatiellia bacterium]